MNKLTTSDRETKLKDFLENGWLLDESRDAIIKEFDIETLDRILAESESLMNEDKMFATD